MIASDIHGSGMYAEKLIERFKEEKPDKLLLLGDLLYHGPRNDLPGLYDPKKVIALLNGIKDDLLCIIKYGLRGSNAPLGVTVDDIYECIGCQYIGEKM